MDITFEERKLQYIQSIESEYMPQEMSYWQHPPPTYHLTSEYIAEKDKIVTVGEAVTFKKIRKEGVLVTVMAVVAALLIYMVGKKEFSFLYVAFLLILLIVVLPVLLNNKTMIRVSREGIWLLKNNKEIQWEQVLLTYIKKNNDEDGEQYFIMHYYDEGLGEFCSSEVPLNGFVSPALLSATIEAYKPV